MRRSLAQTNKPQDLLVLIPAADSIQLRSQDAHPAVSPGRAHGRDGMPDVLNSLIAFNGIQVMLSIAAAHSIEPATLTPSLLGPQ